MNLQQLFEANEIKFSQTAKMKGIAASWSLQAGVTCPASICTKTKEIKPACKSCYAKKGNFHRPNVTAPRKFNQKDWKRADWEDDMVYTLDTHRYFRWFDSGDVYHPKLAEKIFNIMKRTPWTKHWLPTLSYDIPKIKPWLAKMSRLSNVVIRKSSGQVDGTTVKSGLGSTVYTDEKQLPKDIHVCPVGTKVVINKATGQAEIDVKTGKLMKQSSCKGSGCKACWDKKTKQIAYLKH